MTEEHRLVMGVDGGGSKTLALLADENGQVIGPARGAVRLALRAVRP